MPKPPQLRLLVVDAYPDSAEATAQLLELYGYDVRTAHTSAEALGAVGGADPYEPRVVLLDVKLPDGDGFALAAELLRHLAVRPVLIALTGVSGLEERCRAVGFDHYLLKPASPIALTALLAAYADRPNGHA